MDNIRVTHPFNDGSNHICGEMHLEDYEMKEVILPPTEGSEAVKAIAITIYGKHFRYSPAPLEAFVGDIPVEYLQISLDQNSIEGVLLTEPVEGANVDVILGELDHVRHPTTIKLENIQRIPNPIENQEES